ncbi:hypothetical protein E2C01_086593 [Portunus trituberculatus]|uniref:Uncharacterized protein n=1 Tax=Portunus trituberculatus TaxID=210409 RepID=A0A5B7JF16_PORTR|nr:hypothetical protein [Portunus trituberculatus]
MWDTGCSCIVVAEVLPDADVSNCRSCQVAHYLGRVDTFPTVQCYIRCPYFEGWTDTIRAPIMFASVLIVNVPGVRTPKEPYPTFSYDELVSVPGFSSASAVTLPVQSFPKPSSASQDSLPTVTSSVSQDSLPPVTSFVSQDSLPLVTSSVCAVETRASTNRMKCLHPLHLPNLQPLSVTPKEFGHLQKTCDTLTITHTKAATGEIDQARNNSTFQFLYQDGLLYRKCLSSRHPEKVGKLCLVVPWKCRPIVLNNARKIL